MEAEVRAGWVALLVLIDYVSAEARREAKAILEAEYIKYYLVANPAVVNEPAAQLETPASGAVHLGRGVIAFDTDSSTSDDDSSQAVQAAQAKKSLHSAWKHWKKVMSAIGWKAEFPAFN